MAHTQGRLLVVSISLFAFGCSSNSTPSDGGGPLGDLVPPTGLTATPSATSLQVSLSWNAEAAATSGFQVYRSVGGDAEQIAASRSNAYVDSSPPAGTSVSYTVRALNTDTVTDDSAAAVALTIPAAPADLTVTSITTSTITITWTEAMSAVGGDEVSYVTGHSAPVTLAASDNTFTASGLLENTAYTFSVIARNATGSGPPATATFTTASSGVPQDAGSGDDAGAGADAGMDAGADGGGSHPDAGSGNDAGPPGDGGAGAFNLAAYGADTLIVVQWDDQGAASYQVFRAHNAGAFTMIGKSMAPNFADTGPAANPIVAGDSYAYYVVPTDSSGNAQPASSVGATVATGIAVVEGDRFIDDGSSAVLAPDFSAGVTTLQLAQYVLLIPPHADGSLDIDINDALPAYGTTDGHAVFPGVPAKAYVLYSSPPDIFFYEPASARALDFSSSFIGRTPQLSGDTVLDIHLTNLNPWDVNADSLPAMSWGADDFTTTEQSIDQTIALDDGGTTASGAVSSSTLFGAENLIAGSSGDVLYVWQTEIDTSGSVPYAAMRTYFKTASENFVDGSSSQVSGAMAATPSVAQTIHFNLQTAADPSAFLTYTGAVNPSAVFGDVNGAAPYGNALIAAEPEFADNGAYGLSTAPPTLWHGDYDDAIPLAPQLFAGDFSSTGSNGGFGLDQTVDFVNPFPARWDLFLAAYVPFSVQLPVSNVGAVSVAGRLSTQGLLATYLVTGGAAQVSAKVSPVTLPTIDGVRANAAGNAQLAPFSATAPLVFAWGAPAIGAPTRYTVTIWPLDSGSPSGTPAAVIETRELTASLPAGRLDSSRPYVAFITAAEGDANRFGDGVLAYDGTLDFADCISSAFTVQ